MAEVIAAVFVVIVFLLFCVLIATMLVWVILIIFKDVIEKKRPCPPGKDCTERREKTKNRRRNLIL